MSAPGRIRTCDTRFRRAVLYPLSYEGGDREESRPSTALRRSRRQHMWRSYPQNRTLISGEGPDLRHSGHRTAAGPPA